MVGIKISSLEDIKNANLCTGCGLCASIAGPANVRMEIDPDGFYRPVVLQHDQIAWMEIEKACPGIGISQTNNPNANADEQCWGPVLSSFSGHAADETTRWLASSGGALSSLLVYLLDSKQVDFVIHTGVGSDPFRLVIRVSRTCQEVLDNAGSRYAPSSPLADLSEIIKMEPGRFAFVGKPCDVAGLRAYLNLHPELAGRAAVLLSFFCAGVPSLNATYDMAQALGVKKDQVKNLRYRGHGWPGRATVIGLDGHEYSMSYDDSWGKILGKKLQMRCKLCPDGIGEMADISCGDAWFIRDGRPDFEERPGRSFILARTKTGQQILTASREARYLVAEPFDLRQLNAIQPYQHMRRAAILPRLLALRLLGKPTPQFYGFYLRQNARKAGVMFLGKQFLGMLYRSLRRPASKRG